MPQIKILIDTNIYLRLAKYIHPLLKEPIGEKQYCLYIISELEKEYRKSPRLISKFSWVNEKEYIENRKCRLTVSKKQKEEIATKTKFFIEASYDISESISLVDITCLVYAYVLNIAVVTDDIDMALLAEEYDIKIYSSIDILKLMLDNNHVTIKKVEEVVTGWMLSSDTPKNFKEEFKRNFSRDLPEI